jgi:integrase
LLPNSVTHDFKKIVKQLGLDDVRFHDLRHTHATVMLLQGVHPKVVQERLGHSKMSTTMDLYSHVMPSMQKDAVKKFDLALEPQEKPSIGVQSGVQAPKLDAHVTVY